MLRIVSIVFLTALIGACSSSPFYHKLFMSGQVVGVDGDQVVFCVGSETGARVEQEFEAYRATYEDYTEGEEYYGLVKVGTVVVHQIVNEHFAKGTITAGVVTKHDMLFAK